MGNIFLPSYGIYRYGTKEQQRLRVYLLGIHFLDSVVGRRYLSLQILFYVNNSRRFIRNIISTVPFFAPDERFVYKKLGEVYGIQSYNPVVIIPGNLASYAGFYKQVYDRRQSR